MTITSLALIEHEAQSIGDPLVDSGTSIVGAATGALIGFFVMKALGKSNKIALLVAVIAAAIGYGSGKIDDILGYSSNDYTLLDYGRREKS